MKKITYKDALELLKTARNTSHAPCDAMGNNYKTIKAGLLPDGGIVEACVGHGWLYGGRIYTPEEINHIFHGKGFNYNEF